MKIFRLLHLLALGAVVLMVSASPVLAKDSRFLVTSSHTKEECLQALDDVKAVGTKLLTRCDWGCMAGDHTCYVVLEGKDQAAVKQMLPASWGKAKVVKLNKFTPEQIASFHKK